MNYYGMTADVGRLRSSRDGVIPYSGVGMIEKEAEVKQQEEIKAKGSA